MARPKQDVLKLFPEVAIVTRKLTDAQFGSLMRSVFSYRFDGVAYSGDDVAVDMAFQFIANQLDRMAEVSETNSNNARSDSERNEAEFSETPQTPKKRRKKSKTHEKADTEDGTPDKEENPPPSPSPYPSPSPGPYPSPSPNPDPISNNVVADVISTTATRELRLIGGQLGKGVVVLSEDQSADLLEKLGLDMFEYYVRKLADFIIKKNANVKNHYETILKWWREDSHLEEGTSRKEIR